jgi:hypothetical protein
MMVIPARICLARKKQSAKIDAGYCIILHDSPLLHVCKLLLTYLIGFLNHDAK